MALRDEELLTKIKALATVNKEIIQRIYSRTTVVTGYYYSVESNINTNGLLIANQSQISNFNLIRSQGNNQPVIRRVPIRAPTFTNHTQQAQYPLRLQTQKIQQSLSSILQSWALSSQLEAIEDTFNDKIDYNAQTFDDLKNLNEEMLRVAQKYKLFDGTKSALEVLAKFLSNFETIQVELGRIEECLMDAKSSEQDLVTELDSINKEIGALEEKLRAFCNKCKESSEKI